MGLFTSPLYSWDLVAIVPGLGARARNKLSKQSSEGSQGSIQKFLTSGRRKFCSEALPAMAVRKRPAANRSGKSNWPTREPAAKAKVQPEKPPAEQVKIEPKTFVSVGVGTGASIRPLYLPPPGSRMEEDPPCSSVLCRHSPGSSVRCYLSWLLNSVHICTLQECLAHLSTDGDEVIDDGL